MRLIKVSKKKYEAIINIDGKPVILRIVKKNEDDPIKIPRKIRNILLSREFEKKGKNKKLFFLFIGKCIFTDVSLLFQKIFY